MSAGTETTIPRVESSAEEQVRAAVEIQRHYRGHRARRHLKGHGLSPDQRWNEALKEAHYRKVAYPVSRERQLGARLGTGEETGELPSESVKQRILNSRERWDKAVLFARQIQHDDEPSSSSSSDGDSDEESKKKREDERARRRQKRKERIKYSKAMDMQYFLEMVDLKHRYGSNLRAYHSYWQAQPTLENFFYWLDQGSGANLDLSICSRARLDFECVRYLSREERQSYLVKIDHDGRLCWAKNGQHIDTTVKYHDSATGIVPVDTEEEEEEEEEEATATESVSHFRHAHHGARKRSGTQDSILSSSSSDSISSSGSSHSGGSDMAERYVNPDMHERHGPKRVFHVSASTVLNRLLRNTTRKNTWIFVVDNSFRLYVGIKQSGAFQHSSFLHGARVSAAGLIKIKDGRLSSLSPLSGHYRPPANNFRKFVKSLREAGADMSHVSISKSYAILVGLEAYGNIRKGRRKTKRVAHGAADKVVDKVLPSSRLRLMRKGKENKHVEEQYQINKPTRYGTDGTADTGKGKTPDKTPIAAEEKKHDGNSRATRAMKKLCIKSRVLSVAAEVGAKK